MKAEKSAMLRPEWEEERKIWFLVKNQHSRGIPLLDWLWMKVGKKLRFDLDIIIMIIAVGTF